MVAFIAVLVALIGNAGSAMSAQRNCQRSQYLIRFAHDATVRSLIQIEGDPARGIPPNQTLVRFYDQLGIRQQVLARLHHDEERLQPYDCPLFRFGG